MQSNVSGYAKKLGYDECPRSKYTIRDAEKKEGCVMFTIVNKEETRNTMAPTTVDVYEIVRLGNRFVVQRKMQFASLDVSSIPSVDNLTWDGMMLNDVHSDVVQTITEVLRESPDFWEFIESIGNVVSSESTAAVVCMGVLLIPDVLNNFTAFNDPPSILRRTHRAIQSALVNHGALDAVVEPKFDDAWMNTCIDEYLKDSAWAKINACVDMYDATTQT